MIWQKQLKNLEQNKQWDVAIEFMQNIVHENSNNIDAYLSINYLLMNLLVEEKHDFNKNDYYMELLLKYFNESYAKFSDNPEYLFFIARIAYMSVWNFNIELEDAAAMLKKATQIEPGNILYQWGQYSGLRMQDPGNREKSLPYAKMVLENKSLFEKMLRPKGALGDYVFELMTGWSKRVDAGNF